VGLDRGPLSLVMIIEVLFEWKSSRPGLENRDSRPWGSVAPTTQQPLSTKLTDKRRSLGRYSSLADYRPRRFCFVLSVEFHLYTSLQEDNIKKDIDKTLVII
jgi:hypothetical protein